MQLPYMVIADFHSRSTVMYLLVLCFLEFLRIYSNCNVIRIECELRGVRLFFTLHLKLRPKLTPVQGYSYYQISERRMRKLKKQNSLNEFCFSLFLTDGKAFVRFLFVVTAARIFPFISACIFVF